MICIIIIIEMSKTLLNDLETVFLCHMSKKMGFGGAAGGKKSCFWVYIEKKFASPPVCAAKVWREVDFQLRMP